MLWDIRTKRSSQQSTCPVLCLEWAANGIQLATGGNKVSSCTSCNIEKHIFILYTLLFLVQLNMWDIRYGQILKTLTSKAKVNDLPTGDCEV